MNKKYLAPTLIIVVLALLSGGAYWYTTTPSGQDWLLARTFNKTIKANQADLLRRELPTVLPKDRPAEFELYYENRDDEADYTVGVLISSNESYVRVVTDGKITKTPFTLKETTLNTLYQALQTMPFDQIRVTSIPVKMPNLNEIVIGEQPKPKTAQESIRVTFGTNMGNRQNIFYVNGPTTQITDQSKPNWDTATGLAKAVLAKFGPKK